VWDRWVDGRRRRLEKGVKEMGRRAPFARYGNGVNVGGRGWDDGRRRFGQCVVWGEDMWFGGFTINVRDLRV